MDEKTLKSKKVVDLREIAQAVGISGYQKMKKADLIEAIVMGAPEEKETTADRTEKVREENEKKLMSKAKPRLKKGSKKSKKVQEEHEKEEAVKEEKEEKEETLKEEKQQKKKGHQGKARENKIGRAHV